MYTPTLYKNDNLENVLDFVQKNSFGILVSLDNSRPVATHIPLELEKNENGKYVLTGHISKANPQWKHFRPDSEVLAIFNGPHTYVSSSWYDHENVPTWNYIAVHIYGKIKIIEGERLLEILTKLVDKYEKHSEKPVSVPAMSPQFISREMKGIVGFEIEISDIQSAYKLSQNRDDKNHERIVAELKKSGDEGAQQIAAEMEKQRKG